MSKLATCEFLTFKLVSVAEQAGLNLALSETPKTGPRDKAQLIAPELLVIILINLLPLAIWMTCQTKCYNHIPLINPWHREEER